MFMCPVQEAEDEGSSEGDVEGSEVDVDEEEDIMFETDPETGEVINLDGVFVSKHAEEAEDEKEDVQEELSLLSEAPGKPVLEMPASGASPKPPPVEVSRSS
jgi:hypothetical protein